MSFAINRAQAATNSGNIQFGQSTPVFLAPVAQPPLQTATPAHVEVEHLALPGATEKQNFLASILAAYSSRQIGSLNTPQIQALLDRHRGEFPGVGNAYEQPAPLRTGANNLVHKFPAHFAAAQSRTAGGAKNWGWWYLG